MTREKCQNAACGLNFYVCEPILTQPYSRPGPMIKIFAGFCEKENCEQESCVCVCVCVCVCECVCVCV